jgi:hypothetical protein
MSRRDERIIAQGKRSAALGKEPNVNASLFFEFCFSGLQARKNKTRKKGRLECGGPYPGRELRLRYAPAGLGLLSCCPSGAPEVGGLSRFRRKRETAENPWQIPSTILPNRYDALSES